MIPLQVTRTTISLLVLRLTGLNYSICPCASSVCSQRQSEVTTGTGWAFAKAKPMLGA
jgi:hypothetical protein